MHKKIMITSMMSLEEKQKAKEEAENLEIERRLFLLRKMSDNEKVRLILRRSQDARELSQLKLMVQHHAVDQDFINQRAIRYLN